MDKILAVKGILELFGQVSKLRVNFKKSTATLIHCENEEATPIVEHLGCPIVELPISYLVIPLTIYSPWLTRWSACYPLQVTAHTKVKQIGSLQIRAWGYTHPSTTRSTSKEDYQSHGENQEVFMWEGRKATKGCCHVRLMQKSSRLALVKSVHGAIPIHQLLVAPSKKTINLMEKIKRYSCGKDAKLRRGAAM
jgi:hypothetical protein